MRRMFHSGLMDVSELVAFRCCNGNTNNGSNNNQTNGNDSVELFHNVE